MNYTPLHVHTCWSLLDSTVDVNEYVAKIKEAGGSACSITDHNNLKAVVPFFKACKARGIKPIIGVEVDVYLTDEKFIGRLTLIAKNKVGYKNLVNIVSNARSESVFKKETTPKTFFKDLHQYSSGIICMIGDLRSEIFHSCFVNFEMAYGSNSEEECESLLRQDWKEKVNEVLEKYRKVFSDVFLYFDYSKLPIIKVLGQKIKQEFYEAIPSVNVHYISKEDYQIHSLISSDSEALSSNIDDSRIFEEEYCFCHLTKTIPSGEKTKLVVDLVEDFSIEERPMIPDFKVKGHEIQDQDEYLRDICRKGFLEKISPKISSDANLKNIYLDRIRHELGVFKQAKISGYFLIVKDIVDHIKQMGFPADSRGSSSGCLISYLIGVSSIDPIVPDASLAYAKERELPFERFYNEGRNTASNVSLPDIDMDVPPSIRDDVIKYLREKYGKDQVAHIITHSRFKGKGAIKEAFRILKPVNNYFDVSNEITKLFIDESKISDELSELQEEDPSYGIIRWNIDNITDVNKFYNQYKEAFDFAIKIEKLPKNESVHAAGIIIGDRPLYKHFPMTYSSKLGQMVIDIEGSDLEILGGVKFDILGVSAIEKVFQIEKMINKKLNEVRFGELN
jgi:DNA polymerase-3 subunit alpha